ncbi:MAG TPA: glycosyltransferase family 87 protein [Verrucomicrobiae bacterium]|nr:glycosyltransferase family 87 protein [Verrucomicrobiae bacterium]
MVASSAALASGRDRAPWGQALANRRFRWLLLVLAGVPIGLAYVWYGFFKPLLSDEATDFVNTYLAGARVLASGGDPYQCNVGLCGGHPHYLLFYPPLPFWLAQPLIGFDEKVVAGVALVVANVFLLCFVWLVVRALRARDPQFTLIVLLASISFPPTLTEVQNRNLQVAVLMLSAVLLLAWLSGDRWWGGLALGVGLAIKLIQAPLLLLSIWGRRFVLAAACAVSWAVLWMVAAPQFLPEYLLKVAPAQAQGSGEVINVAPFGTVNRLLHPETLYNSGQGGGVVVLALAALAGVAVVIFTVWRLGAPRADRQGRALELAAGVAASPLLVTLAYAGQFVLLLLPMVVLLDFGLRSRTRSIVIAVIVSWVMVGPSYLAFTNAMAAGFGFPLLFQLWANSAVAGVVVLWLAALQALKLHALGAGPVS